VIASSAICCGVTGRYGDIEGVWIAPVTAQVMMILFVAAMLSSSFSAHRRWLAAAASCRPTSGYRWCLASGNRILLDHIASAVRSELVMPYLKVFFPEVHS
jgi:hypothetical protein